MTNQPEQPEQPEQPTVNTADYERGFTDGRISALASQLVGLHEEKAVKAEAERQRVTPPAPTCVRCGHNSGVNRHGECRQCIDWQKHVCEFPPTDAPAGEHQWAARVGAHSDDLIDGKEG